MSRSTFGTARRPSCAGNGKVADRGKSGEPRDPRGFAHGFQTLAEDCELLYLHTRAYSSDAEGAVNAQDPSVAIAWPLAIALFSERDRSPPLSG